ncbi:MAG: Crp/Fnr family transcriptional regulator [Spirochaetaceae bacterium]|nr:MAG: Crp/Fnr family transcriptional regulator [Spirochaetaceae bacterium]
MADARLVLHPLFADADREAISRALDQLRMRRCDAAAGELVLMRGAEYDALGLLVSGALRATIDDMSGRSLLIETLRAPEVLAAPVLYSSQPRLPVTLTAAEPSVLWFIDRADLDRLSVRFPSVYRRLLQDAGDKFVFLSTKLRLIQFTTLRHKIAGFLLPMIRDQTDHPADASDSSDVVITLPYSRERMAELFGVARPSLSRALGEFVREGFFDLDGSVVTVRSVSRLAAVLGESR